MHTVYQWGLSSLTDLASVLDEAMADELFFMVRGRMSRVLSEVGVFEEAAQEIERTMSYSRTPPAVEGMPPSEGGQRGGAPVSTAHRTLPTNNQRHKGADVTQPAGIGLHV